jgi:HK97 gp10 family phage protein
MAVVILILRLKPAKTMAKTGTIKVEGLRELGQRIKKLNSDMANKVARAATAAASGVIRKSAVQKAPIAPEDYVVDGLKVSKGNIPKNIVTKRVKPSETNLTSEHLVVVRGKRKHGYASRIASLQEFGTVKMPANPFIRPAFDENKEKAIDAMKKRIELRLKKAGV